MHLLFKYSEHWWYYVCSSECCSDRWYLNRVDVSRYRVHKGRKCIHVFPDWRTSSVSFPVKVLHRKCTHFICAKPTRSQLRLFFSLSCIASQSPRNSFANTSTLTLVPSQTFCVCMGSCVEGDSEETGARAFGNLLAGNRQSAGRTGG